MAKFKNRVRNPGDPTTENQPSDELIDAVEETNAPDIVVDEPVVKEKLGYSQVVAMAKGIEVPPKASISIDPDIVVVQKEPPKIVLNKGLLGDKMVELLYDMFKEQEPDAELFEYLKLNAAKVVNRISPADLLFWKAVLKRLDKIIDNK